MKINGTFLFILVVSAVWLDQAGADFERVLTIGDSIAAGTGIHRRKTKYDDPDCMAEWDTIPGGRYATANDIDHIISACQSTSIPSTINRWRMLQSEYTKEAASGWNSTLILVTTGINSLRSGLDETWAMRAVRCARTIRCHRDSRNNFVNVDRVMEMLNEFYSVLIAEAPLATVRIFGYPKLFHPTRFVPFCFLPGISVGEAKYLDSSQDFLLRMKETSQNITDTYPEVDFQYIDGTSLFTNGACSPFPWRQVNNIVLSGVLSSLHPTQRGYDIYYEALLASL